MKGKNASDIVMTYSFWNSVMVILKVFSPLVKVLRLADGEKVPSLGFIFGEILEAKKSIKEASDHLEKNYLPVFRIIDEKMKGRLDTPLHMAAYFLNPFYFYKEPNIQLDVEVMEGFLTCVETFYHGDFVKQDLCVNQEVSLYKNKSGSFGRALALKGCETKDDKFDPGLFSHFTCFYLIICLLFNGFHLLSLRELVGNVWMWCTYSTKVGNKDTCFDI